MRYLAEGFVLGLDWWGSKGAYPARRIEAKTKKELEEQIKQGIQEGWLDSGFGFQKLNGALMNIYKIHEVKVAGHKTNVTKFYDQIAYGDLTDEDVEFLRQVSFDYV